MQRYKKYGWSLVQIVFFESLITFIPQMMAKSFTIFGRIKSGGKESQTSEALVLKQCFAKLSATRLASLQQWTNLTNENSIAKIVASTTREKPSSSAGFGPISSAGAGATANV